MTEQTSPLSYAVRFPVLLKYLGQFSFVIAALTLLPLGVSLLDAENGIALRYGMVILPLVGFGVIFARIPVPRAVQRNEAMVLAAFLFLFTPLAMSYPMMGAGIGFVDALFEAVSGATTTGLSTLSGVSAMSPAFLFTRSWMQWYGGLGIVILSLALVVGPGTVAKGLAAAENVEDDLAGGVRAYARKALVVYAAITAAGILLLWVLGVGPFNAILYALASVSTGGFSPHDNSAAGLGSGFAQGAVMLLSCSGAVPLAFYYRLLRDGWKKNTNALQLETILICGGIVVLLLAFSMGFSGTTDLSRITRHAPFLAFSAQSTTGFSTMDPGDLSDASKLILILAMAVGGGVGSTAGGIKVIRLLVVLRCIRLMLLRTRLSTHAVVKPRLAGHVLEEPEIREALTVVLLFFGVIFFSWLPFVVWGFPAVDALFEVVSATATVGLSAGITRIDLPAFLKGILCIDMLLGRLEIVAWMVMISPLTWIGRRR